MEFSHSAGSGIFSFDRPGHGSRERCSTWVFGTPTPQQVEEKYNTMRPEDAYTKLEEVSASFIVELHVYLMQKSAN